MVKLLRDGDSGLVSDVALEGLDEVDTWFARRWATDFI